MEWRIWASGSFYSGVNSGGCDVGVRPRAVRRRRPARPAAVCALALLGGLLGLCTPSAAGAASLAEGEAEYGVSWNGIPAGAATIAVRRDQHAGRPIYRVEALAQTNWFVDLLWHFRGHAMSSFTSDNLAPLGYRYDREENSKHIITDVIFDYAEPSATGVKYGGNEK